MQTSHDKALVSTRWCPFARSHWSPGEMPEYQGNRFFAEDGKTIDPSVGCLGPRCMAWRWVRTHIPNPDAPGGDLIPSDDTHGYCGLAGATP